MRCERWLPGESAILKAYAEGVNAALDSLAGRPFEYVVLPSAPEPWRAEDSLLVLYAMFFELNTLGAFAESGDGSSSERTRGERNTAAIRHPLSPAMPKFALWLDMARDPLPGDAKVPRAQGPSFGAAERFAVSPGDEGRGYTHMPAGQSGHPLSPYYRRGHAERVRRPATPFIPGPATHTLVLRPASVAE